VYPAEVTAATRLALDGKYEEARRAHSRCAACTRSCSSRRTEPAKAALAHKLKISDAVRGPLVRASEAARAKVVAALVAYESSRG